MAGGRGFPLRVLRDVNPSGAGLSQEAGEELFQVQAGCCHSPALAQAPSRPRISRWFPEHAPPPQHTSLFSPVTRAAQFLPSLNQQHL